MQIIHAVRNTPNWLGLNLDNYLHHPNINDYVKNKLFFIIKKWENILEPNYFKFKYLVAEIARGNHQKLHADIRLSTTAELDKNLKSFEKPYIIFLSDDDDWYQSSIVEKVKNYYVENSNTESMTWNHSAFVTNYKIFDLSKTHPYFIIDKKDCYHTNNYCLTDRFFTKLNEKDHHLLHNGLAYDLSYDHNTIEKYFRKNTINYHFKEGIWSMANKTITSYSGWINYETKEHKTWLFRCLSNIVQECQDYRVSIPETLIWATEEILETVDLYKHIVIKHNKLI